MPILVFNETPIKETPKHSFRVERRLHDKYELYETYTVLYDHPVHPGQFSVPVLEEKSVGTYVAGDKGYELVQMLYLNQKALVKNLP